MVVIGVSAEIAAEGFSLEVTVDGYEFPDADLATSDADWLVGSVEIHAGLTGRFAARLPLTPYAGDLASFRGQLQLLDSDLSGKATLRHTEDQFGVEISLGHGTGTLRAFVEEHAGARLTVEHVAIDQSHVRRALNEFNALLRAFPPRWGQDRPVTGAFRTARRS